MIRSLRLSSYGKFDSRELEFGPFTVVAGPNEAGKTTVFDALFDALCADSRHDGRPIWKSLVGRYGTLRKAELTWTDGSPLPPFDAAEFLEIFAVRAGRTGVNAAKGGSWAAAAEARLLSAGLNPAQLADDLNDKAESSRKGSVQARIKELGKTVKALEQDLSAAKARRDAIFSGEAETARLEAELKEKASALEAKKAEQRALNAEQDALSMACRLATAEAGIKALREAREAREALEGLAGFAKDETSAYRALAQEVLEEEKAAASASAALEEKKAAAASAKSSLEALVARLPVLRKQAETAASLSARLGAFASAPPKVSRSVSRPLRYGIWAAAAALAAFVAWSGRGPAAWAAAAAIVAAGAWVGLKLSVKETLSGHTPEETKAFLDALAAEWTVASEEPLPREGLEPARDYLAKAGADSSAAAESLKGRAADLAGLEAGVKASAKAAAERSEALAAAKGAAEAWLRERGCGSEDCYRKGLASYSKLSDKLADVTARLELFRRRLGAASDSELKDRLFMDKEALDQKGVDPAKADEAALKRLELRAAALGKEAHVLEAEAAEIKSALKTAQAVAGAKLEGLPEAINRAETGIAAAAEETADLELQAQGYRLAAEIFSKLAEKSTVAFDALSKEVAGMLSRALSGAEASFSGFDAEEDASLKDAGGRLRPVKYLSSGTHDLFMLAARLAMAKKARVAPDGTPIPGIVVLDEPFYTLDPRREEAALKLLAAFRKETGWQLVLFTKDPDFPAKAKAAGLPVTLVKL